MKKQHTKSITQRFLQICSEVIQEGKVSNKTDFADSVGEHQQNLSQMEKGKRAPTLEQIATACKKYGYSANWLILNQGLKKVNKDIVKRDTLTVEHRVNNLETEVAKLNRQISRIQTVPSHNGLRTNKAKKKVTKS